MAKRRQPAIVQSDIYGYTGKILRMDLMTGETSIEPTARYAKEWIGGSGLAQWIIYNEVKSGVAPYEPANRFIIGAGPLNGTLAPGASRVTADSKGPLTGGVASSNADGHFSAELKFAGYDSLVFQGRASRPVYLWIHDDRIELRDASHLWGKTTWEADDLIKYELHDERVQVMCIGPAGENLARGACIIVNKGRACGRCGLGGVMGSKLLKAIAVRGTGGVKIADPKRFMRAAEYLRKAFIHENENSRFIKYGTMALLEGKQETCGLTYKNFQYLDLPADAFLRLRTAIEEWQRNYRVRILGYPACPRPCDRYFRLDRGPYAGLECQGVQVEALQGYAGKLAVNDPDFIIKINAYCNQLGLDVDSPAGAIGWAMECYEKGILKESDTDGLSLRWGDTDVIMELTRKIAYREGFGNMLAEGCFRAARLLGRGSEYFALHLKGQDLYEAIRSSIGWGLGVCVSTRGGGHTTGAPATTAIEAASKVDEDLARLVERTYGVRTLGDRLAFEGKAELVGYFERLHRVNNALGVCHYVTTWAHPSYLGFPELAELYSAATGWETTGDDLKKCAEKILHVEKAFNILHAGFSRNDDYPPQRCLEEPVPRGSIAGFRLGKERWDRLLDEYYEMHGWDTTTGFPTRAGLEALDLGSIANDLENAGKLGGNLV
jgi:aldehyde:ferredoxin oxidoreductase